MKNFITKKPKINWKHSKFIIKLVRNLYKIGYSTRDIASFIDRSHSDIHRICKGITRDRYLAMEIKYPPRKSKHWRTSRANARKEMEEHLGKSLRTDQHVHHKDEDYTNNDISNLEILSPSEHAKLHHPKNPVPRHKRPERVKYMRKYLATYKKKNN